MYTCGNITAVYTVHTHYTFHSYSDIYLHKHLVLTRPRGALVSGGGEIGKGLNIWYVLLWLFQWFLDNQSTRKMIGVYTYMIYTWCFQQKKYSFIPFISRKRFGLDDLTPYTQSIYPSVYKQLIRALSRHTFYHNAYSCVLLILWTSLTTEHPPSLLMFIFINSYITQT